MQALKRPASSRMLSCRLLTHIVVQSLMGINCRRIISVLNGGWHAAFAQASIWIVISVERTDVIALHVILGGTSLVWWIELVCRCRQMAVLIARDAVRFALTALSPKAA